MFVITRFGPPVNGREINWRAFCDNVTHTLGDACRWDAREANEHSRNHFVVVFLCSSRRKLTVSWASAISWAPERCSSNRWASSARGRHTELFMQLILIDFSNSFGEPSTTKQNKTNETNGTQSKGSFCENKQTQKMESTKFSWTFRIHNTFCLLVTRNVHWIQSMLVSERRPRNPNGCVLACETVESLRNVCDAKQQQQHQFPSRKLEWASQWNEA